MQRKSRCREMLWRRRYSGLPLNHHALLRQDLSPGKGRALPSAGRVSRQATPAGLCFGTAAGAAPGEEGGQQSALANCPVSHGARQTFSFKVRTGLDQRRETLSVRKQPSGCLDPALSGSVATLGSGLSQARAVFWQHAGC